MRKIAKCTPLNGDLLDELPYRYSTYVPNRIRTVSQPDIPSDDDLVLSNLPNRRFSPLPEVAVPTTGVDASALEGDAGKYFGDHLRTVAEQLSINTSKLG